MNKEFCIEHGYDDMYYDQQSVSWYCKQCERDSIKRALACDEKMEILDELAD